MVGDLVWEFGEIEGICMEHDDRVESNMMMTATSCRCCFHQLLLIFKYK